MDYIKVSFPKTGTEAEQEIFIALLAEIGFESFQEEGDALLAYIPAKDFSREAVENIPFVRLHNLSRSMKVEQIKDQNWNAVWESNYPPVVIDDKIYIYAPFHEKRPEIPYNILIKPKMSFGTAHHETTALMLSFLLDEPLKGKRLLDMGSGTAVLAIFASMKGISRADAIDNDEWAYKNAAENLELNGISNVVPYRGDAELLQDKEPYDIILANINKNILLRDMPRYVRCLKNGGVMMLSGFYENDLDDIKSAAEKLNMNFRQHKTKNSWVAARFVKQ